MRIANMVVSEDDERGILHKSGPKTN